MKFRNQKGQSTIEFITAFSAAVGFIFLFLKLAMNYTDGFMVHHATYMASRAYLTSDNERQTVEEGDREAFKEAERVFKIYLPEALINGFNGVLKENSANVVKFTAYIGVWVEYSRAFSLGLVGGKEQVPFYSESFLGREPSKSESILQVCNAVKINFGLSSCSIQATLEDNGG